MGSLLCLGVEFSKSTWKQEKAPMLLRQMHLTSGKVILHVVTLLLPFPSSKPELWVKDGTETRKHGWPDLRTLLLNLSLGIILQQSWPQLSSIHHPWSQHERGPSKKENGKRSTRPLH